MVAFFMWFLCVSLLKRSGTRRSQNQWVIMLDSGYSYYIIIKSGFFILLLIK